MVSPAPARIALRLTMQRRQRELSASQSCYADDESVVTWLPYKILSDYAQAQLVRQIVIQQFNEDVPASFPLLLGGGHD